MGPMWNSGSQMPAKTTEVAVLLNPSRQPVSFSRGGSSRLHCQGCVSTVPPGDHREMSLERRAEDG